AVRRTRSASTTQPSDADTNCTAFRVGRRPAEAASPDVAPERQDAVADGLADADTARCWLAGSVLRAGVRAALPHPAATSPKLRMSPVSRHDAEDARVITTSTPPTLPTLHPTRIYPHP